MLWLVGAHVDQISLTYPMATLNPIHKIVSMTFCNGSQRKNEGSHDTSEQCAQLPHHVRPKASNHFHVSSTHCVMHHWYLVHQRWHLCSFTCQTITREVQPKFFVLLFFDQVVPANASKLIGAAEGIKQEVKLELERREKVDCKERTILRGQRAVQTTTAWGKARIVRPISKMFGWLATTNHPPVEWK